MLTNGMEQRGSLGCWKDRCVEMLAAYSPHPNIGLFFAVIVGKVHIPARQKPGVTETIRRELKHRNANEPEIGHMKQNGLLGHCYLKGTLGDALSVLLIAAGHDPYKILKSPKAFLPFGWVRWLLVMRRCKHSPHNCGLNPSNVFTQDTHQLAFLSFPNIQIIHG